MRQSSKNDFIIVPFTPSKRLGRLYYIRRNNGTAVFRQIDNHLRILRTRAGARKAITREKRGDFHN